MVWNASTTSAGSRPRSATVYPCCLAHARSSALLTGSRLRLAERRCDLLDGVRFAAVRDAVARRRGLAEATLPALARDFFVCPELEGVATTVTPYMASSTRSAFSSGSFESIVTFIIDAAFPRKLAGLARALGTQNEGSKTSALWLKSRTRKLLTLTDVTWCRCHRPFQHPFLNDSAPYCWPRTGTNCPHASRRGSRQCVHMSGMAAW